MYDDLINRLRAQADVERYFNGEGVLYDKAADAIEELIRENESLAKSVNEASEILRRRWTPVTERLPKEKINPYTNDFEPIICSTNFGDVRVYKYGTPIGWNEPHFWNGAGIMDWYVTHWMNLPEPPKEET